MVTGTCAHCSRQSANLNRIRSSEILALFQEHNSSYTRHSQFCERCIGRGTVKLQSRKARALRSNQTGSSSKTGSYSNASGLETTSSQTNRSGRNVAKRTGGHPKNPELSTSNSSGNRNVSPPAHRTRSRSRNRTPNRSPTADDSGSDMVFPDADSEDSSPPRRSGQNVSDAPHVEVEVEIDNESNNCGYPSSESVQVPPITPRRRRERTSSLHRAPTPERMNSMSSTERSQSMGGYRRATGG